MNSAPNLPRSYAPEYDGYTKRGVGTNNTVRLGIRVGATGSFFGKIVALATLLTAAPHVCLIWFGADFIWMMAARAWLGGGWRGHEPGQTKTASLVQALIWYVGSLFCPNMALRMVYGPALWASFTVYTHMLANAAMVAVAFHLDDGAIRAGRAVVIAGVAAGLGLAVVGFGVAAAAMPARYRETFYKHDTLRDYLSRIWDERAVSRPGWGEGQDAARAVIVMDWHVEYLPKKKVREWLKRWEEWERREPPWFTSKWRAALYKYAKGSGMLTKTAARSIEIEAALATAGEGSD